ncbi:ATP-binding protein [Candidatus Dependentiae bacterium]|nr:ATP-binding protein [Candidatus Dependentiae bacterium]
MSKKCLGHILSGSLLEGMVMRLDADCSLEEIKTGKFVSVIGDQYTFFSMIIDLELQVTNPDILLFPPTEKEKLLGQLLKKRDIYARVTLRPMLMLDKNRKHMPVKTIPFHFAPVYEASNQDIAEIFGDEKMGSKYFNIGAPLDMQAPVCLDLERFTERSNGIFGKTGTGKTFITRLILAGMVKSDKAVNLIFDMHSEYGFQARKEGQGQMFVKGLKTLFPHKVAIFSLDPDSTRRRGCSPDVEVVLGYQDIRVEDVMPLQDELNLHPTALEAAYLIAAKYKNNWLQVLLEQEGTIKEFAAEIGAHAESVGALHRKLKRLERFPFLRKTSGATSMIDRLMEYLDKGIHVVLEFGTHTSMLSYLLIANIITRRVHEEYIAKTEKFLASQRKDEEPKKLMITIEEAHKFLNPSAARQTIFGTIAREMRKYYVSLLVVDQRPSGIDPEIISQIGTKVVALLSDEKDIQAVLTGVSNASGLRTVLATLDTKQQVLLLGHAVPMPVIVKTREYNDEFYKDMGGLVTLKDVKQAIDEIF